MSIWSEMEDRSIGDLAGKKDAEQPRMVAKKQIKIFNHTPNHYKLEEEVNNFLEELSITNKKVVDVRYSSFLNDKGGVCWTVMVVYES